jgi:hypothetical protein
VEELEKKMLKSEKEEPKKELPQFSPNQIKIFGMALLVIVY